jgi:hypothetical protein
MLWWWALGVPTLAFPMPAYVEAARRARYPPDLTSVLTPEHVTAALCSVRFARTRACLQRIAARAARSTSPQASAFELFAAVCEIRRQRPADPSALTRTHPQRNGGLFGHRTCMG